MTIDYSKIGWNTAPYKYANPTNMDKMDSAIKAACDGVDAINTTALPAKTDKTYVDNLLAKTSTELLDLKMLGYTVPRELGVQNTVNGNEYTVKVGRVNLGSLSWTKLGTTNFYYADYQVKAKVGSSLIANGLTATDYGLMWANRVESSDYNNTIGLNGNGVRLAIIKSGYNSASDFAKAMANTYLYYELATPYTLTIDGNELYNEQDSLKMLGWTVPKEYTGARNYTDSNGVFHQRVGRVCLGDVSWTYTTAGTNEVPCFATIISNMKNVGEVYCNGYKYISNFDGSVAQNENKLITTYVHYANKNVLIKDSSYTDSTAFRTAMSGVYLYYELATEVQIKEGNEKTEVLENTLDTELPKLATKGKLIFSTATEITIGTDTQITVSENYDHFQYLLVECGGVDNGFTFAMIRTGYYGYGLFSSFSALVSMAVRYSGAYTTPKISTKLMVGSLSKLTIKNIYGINLY